MHSKPALKVLLVSMGHPELVPGDGQQACYELFRALRRREKIETTFLASVDMSLPALFKSGARITGFDRRPDEFLFLSHAYDHLWHKVGSPLLIETFAEFLQLIRPDVVHFHHFLNFGIDLLTLTRRALPEARIVFTLNDFTPICAAEGRMVCPTNGSLCSKATPVHCHRCLPECAPEFFFVREMWMKKHLSSVDLFTAPSRFVIEHCTRWGIDGSRIRQVPHVSRQHIGSTAKEPHRGSRNRLGFFGQLVEHQGVHILLQAVEYLRATGFRDFLVEINGEHVGSASDSYGRELQAYFERERRKPLEQLNVLTLGGCDIDQLACRMARIDWCIIPSVWPDPVGMAISDAWACGRAVIASKVGAMEERIRPGRDGLHFEMGDPRSLAEVMRRACTEEGLWDRLVKGTRASLSREHIAERYLELYQGLIRSRHLQ